MKWNEVRKHFGMLSKKAMTGVIAAAMVGTSLAGCSAASEEVANANVEMTKERTEESGKSADAQDGVMSALLDTVQENTNQSNEEQGKEETVYIFADSEGNMTSTVVSGWLKNPEGLDVLTDLTDASDVFNVKGDETFSKEGSEYRWEANGSDIYYQGTTTKEAPVTEKITYYLDGKEISPKELAGKSGKVRIRFDYENTQTTTAQINGKEEEIAVPFAVVTGMILNDRFQNISVENGRLVSDGKNNMVIGFALPGLKESLKLDDIDLEDSDEEIRVPDYVEVSADVEDFALDMTLTVATSSADLSFDKTLDFSDLDEKIDTLTDSSAQLADGTKELTDGIQTLKDSLGEFSDGVASLKDGIVEYTDGAGKLADGISEVKDGADSLDSGAGALVDGVNALQDGANALKDGIDSAASGAKELKDGIDSAKSGAGELKSGIDSAASGAKELKAGIDSANSGAKELSNGINTTLKGGTAQLAGGITKLQIGLDGDGTGDNPGAVNGAKQVAAGIDTLSSTLDAQITAVGQMIFNKESELLIQLYGLAGQDITAALNENNIGEYAAGANEVAQGILTVAQGRASDTLTALFSSTMRTTASKAKDLYYVQGYEAGYEDASQTEEKRTSGTENSESGSTEEKNIDGDAVDGENGSQDTEQAGGGEADEKEPAGDSGENGEDTGSGNDDAEGQEDPTEDSSGAENAQSSDDKEESGSGDNGGAAGQAEEEDQTDVSAIATAYSYGNGSRESGWFSLNGKNQKQYRVVALADGDEEQEIDPETVIEKTLSGLASTANGIGQMQGAIQTLEEMRSTIGTMKGALAKIKDLQDGADSLADGLEELSKGAAALSQGAAQLQAGVEQLGVGALTLSSGMDALASGSGELTDGMGKLASGSSELTDGMGKLASGSGELTDGMGKLKDGSSELTDGTKELQSGSYELKDGTQKLKDGAGELADGAKELTDNSGALVDGADELADGTLQVVDGVDELYDGAGKLLDGMLEFDEEGIQKIADAYNGDVKALTDRVKAISDAGSSYDNFCGKADDTKSSVKFIIRTEPVK